jgi:superfamily II DNA or RNA helicase
MLQKLIPNSVFLYGQNKTKERRMVYERFANEDNITVIATMKIASTGISIDRIFFLGLVDINKSFTKVIQAIGRGLRKKGDKNSIFCKDYYSSLKWSKKHFSQDRKKFYVDAKYPVLPVVKIKI